MANLNVELDNLKEKIETTEKNLKDKEETIKNNNMGEFCENMYI